MNQGCAEDVDRLASVYFPSHRRPHCRPPLPPPYHRSPALMPATGAKCLLEGWLLP
jgi:hypothetical protein